eukprot:COSAG01_NODE_116_length_25522_cov_187.094403_7_plen_100_part_00
MILLAKSQLVVSVRSLRVMHYVVCVHVLCAPHAWHSIFAWATGEVPSGDRRGNSSGRRGAMVFSSRLERMCRQSVCVRCLHCMCMCAGDEDSSADSAED